MRHFIGFCLVILLSSCATTTTNYYRGSQESALIARMGQPYEKIVGPNSTTYIYRTITYRSPPESLSPEIGVANANSPHPAIVMPSANLPRSQMALVCFSTFVINKKGYIVSSKKEGSGCSGM